jgi:phenylacetic acid degradation protein paaN
MINTTGDDKFELLENAIVALHDRSFFSHFPENPLPEVYGEGADQRGQEAFTSRLNNRFGELMQGEPEKWVGQEESPFTQQSLGVQYPYYPVENLVQNGEKAFDIWRKIKVEDRAGILLETLNGYRDRFFEIAQATMHTSGQAFMMAFQASGPHSADRALEAIAAGYEEQTRFPEEQTWEKPVGKHNIRLSKTWRAVPKGLALVIGCSTFPVWNSVPGIYASLITGNPVVVKPHPKAVLPIALVVAEIQKVLAAHQLDPCICQLAVDPADSLITKELAEHPAVKIIDYTGGSEFGNYLENLRGKVVFTEKTGVNSIILDSVEDMEKVAQNLAFSVSLYSGQMCTAPQNIFIPKDGVSTKEGNLSYEEVVQKLAAAVSGLAQHPKAGPQVLGAIQNPEIKQRVEKLASQHPNQVLSSGSITNPQFPDARTCTPTLQEVAATDKERYSRELFGPIVLIIKTKDTNESIKLAKELAIRQGALSCGAYTQDEETKEKIKDEMALAATSVSFNLTGGIYVNQNAGFSDFHATGGNPAGNASFTNPEFVIRRFTWVGFREPKAG